MYYDTHSYIKIKTPTDASRESLASDWIRPATSRLWVWWFGQWPWRQWPPSCDVSVDSGDCDSDGVVNSDDEFPLDASRSCTVTDENSGSGTTADCDNDGETNDADNCPAAANSDQTNTDRADDGGDACDTDDDDDGELDTADVDDDNDGLIEIATSEELDDVRRNLRGTSYDDGDTSDNTGCPTTGGCNGYELIADIDLTDIANWQPIGATNSAPFRAIFDGNGFRVSNMVIDTNSGTRIGLFGVGGTTSDSAIIRNLHVSGSIVYRGSAAASIGGLMGFIQNGSTLDGCSSAVVITGGSGGFQSIGGLVGSINGRLWNSWATGAVHSCGGDPTDRGSCEATGCSCSGGGYIGGLVGQATAGIVRNSYATGAVRGNALGSTGVGGLVGFNAILVEDSYATGDVVGGSGADTIGGLFGSFTTLGSVNRSYATGRVDDGDGDSATADNIGGLSGLTPGSATISASYYSGMINSISIGGGVVTGDRVSSAVGATVIPRSTTDALQMSDTDDAIYSTWDTRNWDFGAVSQFPALKSFVDNNNDGDNEDANEEGVLLCGQPAPRAQCSS